MTQAGVPTIYYGDEIGMKFLDTAPPKEGSTLVDISAPNGGFFEGERAGTRTPMQWDKSETAGFSTASVEQLYLPVDSSPDRVSVSESEKDCNSLLNFVRKLIEIRKNNSALNADGKIEFLNKDTQDYPLVYTRHSESQHLLIVLNPADSDEVFEVENKFDVSKIILNHGVELKDSGVIEASKFSYLIAEIK
jgi:maltose alpha-D-glucosyltransferase/alpha-amylase